MGDALRNKRIRQASGRSAKVAALPIKSSQWPEAHAPAGPRDRHQRHHQSQCLTCAADFSCTGPDETGLCAPVCPPCYWIELGTQARAYRLILEQIERKRARIEARVGR